MNQKLRHAVRDRAANRCEYCGAHGDWFVQSLVVDHIIAIKHQGSDELENLAWACFHCDAAKGSNIAGSDPLHGALTRLFNPRRDIWDDHFMLLGHYIEGRTAVGRVTVDVLGMNHPLQVALRQAAPPAN